MNSVYQQLLLPIDWGTWIVEWDLFIMSIYISAYPAITTLVSVHWAKKQNQQLLIK